jgi:NDP-sugar pyrophosphorylase family protein
MVRLAHSLPKGSSERRGTLSRIMKVGGMALDRGPGNVPGLNILEDAKVSRGALVSGRAKIYGSAKADMEARVFGSAEVFGSATVSDHSEVYGFARVYGNCDIYEEAKVYEKASVFGEAQVYGRPRVFGQAQVYGRAVCREKCKVSGNSKVHESAEIMENAEISGTAEIRGRAMVYGKAKVGGDAVVAGSAWIGGDAVILGGVWDGSGGEVSSGVWNGPGDPVRTSQLSIPNTSRDAVLVSSLVKLASSMSKGSPERRTILADLAAKNAQVGIDIGTRVVVPNKYTTYGTYSNIGTVEMVYDNGVTSVKLPPLGNEKPGYHGYSQVLVPIGELKRAPKRG